MKVASIEQPGESQPLSFTLRTAAAVGSIARRMAGVQPERSYEPADETAIALGRFIAGNLDMTRMNLVKIDTRCEHDTLPVYQEADILEIPHSQRYSEDYYERPLPQASLRLYGKNYHRFPAVPTDDFMCQFGIFDIDDGGRLVQAVPYEWEGPSYQYEYAGMRSSLNELFGPGETEEDLESLSRINLGLLQTDGIFVPFRQVNMSAFGSNLIPILDTISSPTQKADLSLLLTDGQIQQF